jgi:hypothetical protein
LKEFKYFGKTLTEDNDISIEIKRKIITANKTSYGLQEQLNSPYLKRQTKCMFYKTLIRPTLMSGSEGWPLSKKDEHLLQIFGRRILKRIYGPINEGGIWRIRYNNELYKVCSEPDSQRDQNRKTEVAGTPLQNERAGPWQQVNITQTRGHSTCRKPRTRWLESVETDLRKMGVKNWRRKTQEREQWTIFKEAKVHQGL